MATSITQDKEFINALYYYRRFKNIWKTDDEDTDARRQARTKMIEFYINLINICVTRIHEGSASIIDNNYLKYIHWKELIIEQNITDLLSELRNTADATELEHTLIQNLNTTRDLYERVKIEYLWLNTAEMAKIEEYVRAYNILKRSNQVTPNKKLIENVASRFSDYLTTIATKSCLNNFGRMDCDEQVLREEANYILHKLEVSGCIACKDLTEKAWNAFTSFQENDEANRLSQEQEIIAALETAHMRANETRLQRFKRQLREAIAAIELRLDWVGSGNSF